jgi:putative SOS response-associated peptidase YedK
MCGRFVRSSSAEYIARAFGVDNPGLDMKPSFNIAPSQTVLIINSDGIKQLGSCRWGLIPHWAKDPSIGSRMINARAETVDRKPSFKSSFIKRRCLIIADGFFEWDRGKNKKIPVCIRLRSHEPFGFAGLYSVWVAPSGEKTCTCAIITTEANELLRPIHERMPVIVPKEEEGFWLDPVNQDFELLKKMLKAYRSSDMEFYEVSTKVNSPSNDFADIIMPVN